MKAEPLIALGSTLRVLRPAPKIRAFYDGRIAGRRVHAATENWLDDAAFALGICSYAVVDGGEALVYDTHVSLAHARAIRAVLAAEGAVIRYVVLSHWHVDHVAGNAAFTDCPIVASARTAELLAAHRGELEAGDPPIRSLVLPTRTFDDALDLVVGSTPVALRRFEIHSPDATVALVDDLLLAGDTLEDPVTWLDEPERLAIHLAELDRLAGLDFARILPAHGAAETIAAGGYGRGLVAAARRYGARLLTGEAEPSLAAVAAEDFATGAIGYFAPYETVHRQNLARLRASRATP